MILDENIGKWRARMEFIERHLPHFRSLPMRCDNGPKDMCRLEMFTCLTQHIYANSCTELVDMGIKIEMERGLKCAEDG